MEVFTHGREERPRPECVIGSKRYYNHLPPEALAPSLEALAGALADGGVLVFDDSPLPPAGNHPALDVGTTDRGDYARIAQHVPTDGARLEWREVVFAPDGGSSSAPGR